MGEMDPFVEIELLPEKKKFRTRVIEDAGKAPAWNETIDIPVSSVNNAKFMITCFDEDVMMDDFVGQKLF